MILDFNIDMLVKVVVALLLLIISIVDLKKLYIPNFLTFILIIIGMGYNFIFKGSLENSILGMGVYSIPFSLIYGYLSDLLDKEVLGYGDIKLAMGIGAYLGYTNLWDVYLFFTYSFFIGSIYAIYLLIKIKKRDIQLPFAPFISISGCIMIFF